ncbi:oligosaccharide flippase family protein [Mangrovimonas sp. ST2L15]|uniref:oligosaccharide flippase family protein n=1 Tax=Mangrovimonas sp. ST2L15 TaxID=1645916 RepID=UPI0018D1F602|nr:oligosaccharide flippase family protein [Mangrovimonas sp. ST2L15]
MKKRLSNLDIHTKEVFSKGYYSMIVKIFGIIARLLVSIFIGQTLGPEGLGNINLINQIITILMVFSTLGLDNVLVKNISVGVSQRDFSSINNNIYSSVIIGLFSSFTVIVLGILSSRYLAEQIFESEFIYTPLLIMFCAILPQTIGQIYASGINGYRKVWQSNLLKEVLTSVIIGIGLIIYWIFAVEITILNIILLYALGKVVTFFSARAYWHKLFRKKNYKRVYDPSILKDSLPLLLVSSMVIISTSTDVIMLGWLSDSAEVGLYSVASRLALFVLFFLQVSNSSLAPKIASFYELNKKSDLQVLVQRVTLFLVPIGILFLFAFILLGKPILGLWGVEFKEAYNILIILGLGQLINISTGCSGLLLILCGFGKVHSYISTGYAIFNIFLNFILIQKFGAIGAATATSLVIALENITKVYFARKFTGILSIPLFK